MALAGAITIISTGAGVHCTNKLKIGRKSGLLGSTGQMNNAIFQGLTQDF
ncbi:hypothetical protein BAZSYMB_V2SCAFFOLD00085_5 [Bathymodiolus azoricus thioautotrophic gill symbiont]|uniref:Uncharacterized protein n=1 Tax=Bathymodiolus azoricus thioautotrophic gill symbiont TaxID=235205 RepID=A0A1H6JRL0_9GAMM|nr:hypothetical protein BAZSYMB_V2SCAFFOLD00085_5 [Bathymodiolus azoricus thioautotrophic gill symbiont]